MRIRPSFILLSAVIAFPSIADTAAAVTFAKYTNLVARVAELEAKEAAREKRAADFRERRRTKTAKSKLEEARERYRLHRVPEKKGGAK